MYKKDNYIGKSKSGYDSILTRKRSQKTPYEKDVKNATMESRKVFWIWR